MSNQGDKNTGFNSHAVQLINQGAYEMHPVYGAVPADADLDNREWGSIASIYSELLDDGALKLANKRNHMVLARLSGGELDGVSHWDDVERSIREETGFEEFSLLQQGNSAVAILGRNEHSIGVLRVCTYPTIRDGRPSIDAGDSIRVPMPGLLQGLREPLDFQNKVRIEVLPYAHVINFSFDERKSYEEFVADIVEGTCFQTSVTEAVMLPDATLLILDPGECRYKDSFWDLSEEDRAKELQRSLSVIAERQSQLDVHDHRRWFDMNGGLKQDRFFSSAFKRGDMQPAVIEI